MKALNQAVSLNMFWCAATLLRLDWGIVCGRCVAEGWARVYDTAEGPDPVQNNILIRPARPHDSGTALRV